MKYQFRTDIETKVPTCALIENYQDLSIAIQNGDWDLVEVVADCLADTINDYTIVPEGLHIKPSGSSMVLMSEESGVIVGEDGEDIRCIAAGEALQERVAQRRFAVGKVGGFYREPLIRMVEFINQGCPKMFLTLLHRAQI